MLLNLLVTIGMLIVVPLGLPLIKTVPSSMRTVWLVGATPGAVSLWLPRGTLAAILAGLYLLTTVMLASNILRTRFDLAIWTALASPMVAASSLVAERAAYPLMGFDLEILSLTVAHFHYAGFAAALIAGLTQQLTGGLMARMAGLSVPLGIGIVFAGYFVNDMVELAGAVVLTIGMWLVSYLTVRHVMPLTGRLVDQVLLATSAVVLLATMLLALNWALGQATGMAHLSLEWMVATHGVANALGFGLCGILAWRGRTLM